MDEADIRAIHAGRLMVQHAQAKLDMYLNQLKEKLASVCPGEAEHKFVKHRDGKPPWCNHCRYDIRGNHIGAKK